MFDVFSIILNTTEIIFPPKELKKVKATIAEGVRDGLKECQNQFKWSKWNCTVNVGSRRLPIFVRSSLPHGKSLTQLLFLVFIVII